MNMILKDGNGKALTNIYWFLLRYLQTNISDKYFDIFLYRDKSTRELYMCETNVVFRLLNLKNMEKSLSEEVG